MPDANGKLTADERAELQDTYASLRKDSGYLDSNPEVRDTLASLVKDGTLKDLSGGSASPVKATAAPQASPNGGGDSFFGNAAAPVATTSFSSRRPSHRAPVADAGSSFFATAPQPTAVTSLPPARKKRQAPPETVAQNPASPSQGVADYLSRYIDFKDPNQSINNQPYKTLMHMVADLGRNEWDTALRGYSPIGRKALTYAAERMINAQKTAYHDELHPKEDTRQTALINGVTVNHSDSPLMAMMKGIAAPGVGAATMGQVLPHDVETGLDLLSRRVNAARVHRPIDEAMNAPMAYAGDAMAMQKQRGFLPALTSGALEMTNPSTLATIAATEGAAAPFAGLIPVGRAAGLGFMAAQAPAVIDRFKRGDIGGALGLAAVAAGPEAAGHILHGVGVARENATVNRLDQRLGAVDPVAYAREVARTSANSEAARHNLARKMAPVPGPEVPIASLPAPLPALPAPVRKGTPNVSPRLTTNEAIPLPGTIAHGNAETTPRLPAELVPAGTNTRTSATATQASSDSTRTTNFSGDKPTAGSEPAGKADADSLLGKPATVGSLGDVALSVPAQKFAKAIEGGITSAGGKIDAHKSELVAHLVQFRAEAWSRATGKPIEKYFAAEGEDARLADIRGGKFSSAEVEAATGAENKPAAKSSVYDSIKGADDNYTLFKGIPNSEIQAHINGKQNRLTPEQGKAVDAYLKHTEDIADWYKSQSDTNDWAAAPMKGMLPHEVSDKLGIPKEVIAEAQRQYSVRLDSENYPVGRAVADLFGTERNLSNELKTSYTMGNGGLESSVAAKSIAQKTIKVNGLRAALIEAKVPIDDPKFVIELLKGEGNGVSAPLSALSVMRERADRMPDMTTAGSTPAEPKGGGLFGDEENLPLNQQSPSRTSPNAQDDLGFYSHAESVVSAKMGGKMNAADLAKMLTANGVKPDEMKHTGLGDFLATRGGEAVTKAEVLAHLSDNKVQLREITGGSEYGKYRLPGGTNYKEFRLVLPGNQYKSSHYAERGIIAHFRTSDRTNQNGDKILQVHEIQADINNDRLQGKEVPDAPFKGKEFELATRRILRYAAENGYDAVGWDGGDIQAARFDMSKKVDRITYDPKAQVVEAYKKGDNTPVVSKPATPDELAGVVGKELSHALLDTEEGQIHKIPVHTAKYDTKTGLLTLHQWRFDKELRRVTDVPPEDLPAHIGESATQQLMKRPFFSTAYKADISSHGLSEPIMGHSIDVPGVTLGGGGKNRMYDEMIPAYMNKLGKPHGAQVETTKINTEPGMNGMTRWNRKTAEVPILRINDAMRDHLLEQGNPLFQSADANQTSGDVIQAEVNFLKDRRAVVSFFGASNLSSAIHEIQGHVFEGDLYRDFDTPNGNGFTHADWETTENWAGVKDIEAWRSGRKTKANEAAHEKFARGAERYFYDGYAPNEQVRKVFEAVATYMRQIYKTLKRSAIDVDISPEMRRVYDKLFAGEAGKPNAAEPVEGVSPPRTEAAGAEPAPNAPTPSADAGMQAEPHHSETQPRNDTGRFEARNAGTAADRAYLGLEELPAADRKSLQDSFEEGRSLNPLDVIKKVNRGDALTDAEVGALARHGADVKAKLQATETDPTGDDYKNALTDFDEVTRALKSAGRTSALGLVARKLSIKLMDSQDYSVSAVQSRLRAASGGKENPEAEAKGRESATKLAEVEKQLATVTAADEATQAEVERLQKAAVSADTLTRPQVAEPAPVRNAPRYGTRNRHFKDRAALIKQISEIPEAVEENVPLNQTTRQTDTPEFKRWFGDSKVVDESGKPLKVYHATNDNFNTFDQNKTQDSAFWFTSDKSKLVSGEAGAAGSKIVKPYYLSSDKIAGWDEYDKFGYDELIQKGYSGVKLDDDYIIFDANRIKSADKNNGNFDPNDANTLHQTQEASPLHSALADLGAYHLEAGSRNFEAWSKAMREDVKKAGRPEPSQGDLLAAYANAKHLLSEAHKKDGGSGTTEEAFIDGTKRLLRTNEANADFVNRVAQSPGGADLLAKFAGGGRAALTPAEFGQIVDAFTEAKGEAASQRAQNGKPTPAARAESVKQLAEVNQQINDNARNARLAANRAKVQANRKAKQAPAPPTPPTADELFRAGLVQRYGTKGTEAFLQSLPAAVRGRLLDGTHTGGDTSAILAAHDAGVAARPQAGQKPQTANAAALTVRQIVAESAKAKLEATRQEEAAARQSEAQSRQAQRQAETQARQEARNLTAQESRETRATEAEAQKRREKADAAAVEAAKPIAQRFVENLPGNDAAKTIFRDRAGDPLIKKLMAGQTLTDAENRQLLAAHTAAFGGKAPNAAQPMTPYTEAKAMMRRAIADTRKADNAAKAEANKLARQATSQANREARQAAAPGLRLGRLTGQVTAAQDALARHNGATLESGLGTPQEQARREAAAQKRLQEPVDIRVLRNKRDLLRAEINRQIEDAKPKGHPFWSGIADAVGLSRAVLATGDWSGILRQGAVLGASHPFNYVKTLAKSAAASTGPGSEGRFLEFQRDLSIRKSFGEAQYAGLHFDDPLSLIGGHRAEDFSRGTNVLDKLEGGAAKAPSVLGRLAGKPGEVVGKGIGFVGTLPNAISKASERHMGTTLNHLRLDAWEEGTKNFPNMDDAEKKSLANYINAVSGRGPGLLPKGGDILFFSQKFLTSRLVSPTYMFTKGAAGDLARKNFLKFATTNAAVMAAAIAAGASVSLDPKSPDFMKIKKGNFRLDIGAGFTPAMRLLFGIAGESKEAWRAYLNHGEHKADLKRSVAEPVGDFLAMKASPTAGLASEFLFKHDVMGQEVNPLLEAVKAYLPLVSMQPVDVAKQTGWGSPAPYATLAGEFLGAGTSYYPPKENVRALPEKELTLPFGGKGKLIVPTLPPINPK